MIVLGKWGARPVNLSIKPNCLTISIDGPSAASVFSYDYAGRLWTAYLDGVSYRRGLDGKMVAKWRLPGAARDRRWLAQAEALRIEESARQQSLELYAAIQTGDVQLNAGLSDQGHQGFASIHAFDEAASVANAARYHQVYQPVGILPPDQYMAVVLQATEGCSFNTCTFCSFYKGRAFRIKPPDEFEAHARAVRDFLGAGLSLRRTIFLGDANALVVPMPRLLTLMERVHRVFDVRALGGMYAFLDGFSAEKKPEADYCDLAEQGLVRVYIGLESGSERLLKFLRKPGRPADAVQAVRAMKVGGIAVGVIVLLGAGGQEYAADHVRETSSVLNAMNLDADDIVYFSELMVSDDLPYARDMNTAGLTPLTALERAVQGEMIEHGLRFTPERGIPPISRYDIREFIY